MSFVVDASVALAWCFEDEADRYADGVLDRLGAEDAVAPAIWPLEVANALWAGERRGRLTQAQTARFLTVLADLPVSVDSGTAAGAWGPVLTAARTHNLSAYDASYLELAARRGLPLATRDLRLQGAARRTGVPLLQVEP